MPVPATTHLDLAELVQLVMGTAADLSQSPDACSEEREAARYLYERLQNYRGMLRKRALTRSVEFIIGHLRDDGRVDAGWYYAGGPSSARNWIGPFRTRREAIDDRDKNLPRTRSAAIVAATVAALLAD